MDDDDDDNVEMTVIIPVPNNAEVIPHVDIQSSVNVYISNRDDGIVDDGDLLLTYNTMIS